MATRRREHVQGNSSEFSTSPSAGTSRAALPLFVCCLLFLFLFHLPCRRAVLDVWQRAREVGISPGAVRLRRVTPRKVCACVLSPKKEKWKKENRSLGSLFIETTSRFYESWNAQEKASPPFVSLVRCSLFLYLYIYVYGFRCSPRLPSFSPFSFPRCLSRGPLMRSFDAQHRVTIANRSVRRHFFNYFCSREYIFAYRPGFFYLCTYIYICLQKTVFLEILRVSECNDRSFLHVSKSHRHNLAVIGSSILFESRVFFFQKL